MNPRFTFRRPSPAMLVALLALFVALGGTAMAVHVKLGKNDVKSKNIKKNAVTTKKIKNANVTTAKIADGNVTAAKLSDDAKGDPGFARVSSAGALSQSRGVVSVVPGAAGEICFDLSFTPKNVVVSLDRNGFVLTGGTALAGVPAGGGCPDSHSDAKVLTLDPANLPLAQGFYVQFD